MRAFIKNYNIYSVVAQVIICVIEKIVKRRFGSSDRSGGSLCNL